MNTDTPYIQIVTNNNTNEKYASLLLGCPTAYNELTTTKFKIEAIEVNFFNKQGKIYLTLPYKEALQEISKYL